MPSKRRGVGKRTTRVGSTSGRATIGVRQPPRRGTRARQALDQALTASQNDLEQVEAAASRRPEKRHTSEMTSATAKLSDQSAQLAAASAQPTRRSSTSSLMLNTSMRRQWRRPPLTSPELQGQYEHQLGQATTVRESIEQELRDTETTLDRVRRNTPRTPLPLPSDSPRKTRNSSQPPLTRQSLEQRILESEAALKNAEERAVAERTVARGKRTSGGRSSTRRAGRRPPLARGVERDLAATRTAADPGSSNLPGRISPPSRRDCEIEASLTERLARERTDHEARFADQQQRLRALISRPRRTHQARAPPSQGAAAAPFSRSSRSDRELRKGPASQGKPSFSGLAATSPPPSVRHSPIRFVRMP